MKAWMKAVLVILVLLLAYVGTLVWRRNQPSTPPPLTDREVAEGWLECVDCMGPFLARLSELKGRTRDSVVRFLDSAATSGPSSERLQRHRSDLASRWAADSSYWARTGRGPPHEARDEFQNRFEEGFKVKYRSRAALALGVIRGDSALAALDELLAQPVVTKSDSAVGRAAKFARGDSARTALQHFE